MKNVILYCRVSTDEQREGTSIEVQEQCLRAYCSNKGYNVLAVYKEDYSAKGHTLDRPEFDKLYRYCKSHKGEVDMVLFLRWDRFSRNLEFATTYKRKFVDEMGIEINSIESPIDFNGAEWCIQLGVHCGVAHTEDIKISKRTKDGIHGSQLKGKCTNHAPRGYKNVRLSKHECWVEVDEPKAAKIREVFREVAKGVEAPTRIKRRFFPNLADSSFFDMLRNRFYIGEIKVASYNGDPEHYVKGLHAPLIDRPTFDKAQEVINSKKKTPKLGRAINPDLYLRKFLVCPVCGHPLTGAVSTGNGGQYTYYYCNYDHKHIKARADDVNEGFISFVSTLKPNKSILALYNEILQDIRGEKVQELKAAADSKTEQIGVLQKRKEVVMEKFLDGELTTAEKVELIDRIGRQISTLQNEIDTLRLNADTSVRGKLDYAINLVANLAAFFKSASYEVKIKLLSSIFPEKVIFDGKKYRTNSYNEILDLIYQETKQLRGGDKEKAPCKRGSLQLSTRSRGRTGTAITATGV